MGRKLMRELGKKSNMPASVCVVVQGLGAFDEMNYMSLHMLGYPQGNCLAPSKI